MKKESIRLSVLRSVHRFRGMPVLLIKKMMTREKYAVPDFRIEVIL
jgi:hypothetical protein